MLDRIRVIDIAFFILISSCDKCKKGVVFDDTGSNLSGIFYSSVSEAVGIVAGSCYAYHQLVPVGLHGLLEPVVLSSLFVCCYLVSNGKIAVE